MKEKLQCVQCDVKWEREKVRGRKPLFCPECSNLNAQEEANRVSTTIKKSFAETEGLTRKIFEFYIPGPSQWSCGQCSTLLKVNVGVTAVPLHWCSANKKTQTPLQQQVKKERKTYSTAQ